MTDTLTTETINTPDPATVPVEFTLADRQMLTELHAAVTGLANTFGELMPQLANSPIGAMLGMKS